MKLHSFKIVNTTVLVVALMLNACSGPDTSIFPLSEGYWWQYVAVRTIRGEDHEQKLIIANLPPMDLHGVKVYPQKRADGKMDYYEKSESAIFRLDPEDGEKTQILGLPVAIGTKWQASSKILFLKVTGAFESTYNRRIKEPILIDYEIVATDELVKVKAGKFYNCIKVKGAGSLYGGGGSLKEFMDIDSINIETEEWYAPGVGLVKRTRKEYTAPLDFQNHYQEELESVRID